MKIIGSKKIRDEIGGREVYIMFGPYMKGTGIARAAFWDQEMTDLGKKPWIEKYRRLIETTGLE